jgi:hypothetical protein
MERDVPADPSHRLRLGLLGLSAFSIVGLGFELAFLRHWGSALEATVWPVLLVLVIGWVTIARGRSARGIVAARWLAAATVAMAVIGVGVHVWANLQAAPLDREFAATWSTLPPAQQLFLAVTGGVGPAPTLAPGALAEIALTLALSTVGHPALSVRRDIPFQPASAMPM